MTSPRLLFVDDLIRADHFFLATTDTVFFLREYTPRMGFSYSTTNDLILNFKKKPGTPGQPYKQGAINTLAEELSRCIRLEVLSQITFVPVPPSKAQGDPLYDDRLVRLLRRLHSGHQTLDIREVVVQSKSMSSAHDSEQRPTIAELKASYQVRDQLLEGIRSVVVIFDDVLTTGSHFKAVSEKLSEARAGLDIQGLFLARTTRQPKAVEDRVPGAD